MCCDEGRTSLGTLQCSQRVDPSVLQMQVVFLVVFCTHVHQKGKDKV